jgi:hypothetical protein
VVPKATHEAVWLQTGGEHLVLVKPDWIVMIPEPKDLAERAAGLHRDVWQETDAYLEDERNSW